MRYCFACCVLDTRFYVLRRAGQSLRLRPKVFNVCCYLIEHRDRFVARDELMQQVWPGQYISQGTLEATVRELRQALDDSGRTQRILQTRNSHGYRFVAAVEACPPTAPGA